MAQQTTWLINGTVVTPKGLVRSSIGIQAGRIVAIRSVAPRQGERINARGQVITPGLIDLHIWGDPAVVARETVKGGTTSFLTTVGPESPEWLVNHLVQLNGWQAKAGAQCLGIHLEGPFLNPLRAGALASRWLRPPTSRELKQLLRVGKGRIKLITIAPELPRATASMRWCARHRITVSMGHSDANAYVAQRAVAAGARAVTHVFNGMRPLHHRDPGLLGEALTDDRLMAMIILDGIHVDPKAFQLLLRCKGPAGVVLVTDSIQYQRRPAHVLAAHRAYRLSAPRSSRQAGTAGGILAGSKLSMIEAVRNAVIFGKIALSDAVRMASANPARLIGQSDRGTLEIGKRADLVVFDPVFRVSMTIVGGRVVYKRQGTR